MENWTEIVSSATYESWASQTCFEPNRNQLISHRSRVLTQDQGTLPGDKQPLSPVDAIRGRNKGRHVIVEPSCILGCICQGEPIIVQCSGCSSKRGIARHCLRSKPVSVNNINSPDMIMIRFQQCFDISFSQDDSIFRQDWQQLCLSRAFPAAVSGNGHKSQESSFGWWFHHLSERAGSV